MKAQEIRELESDELHARIAELKEELFNLRFQLATGQLDNHARLQIVKREVARIRTILRERDFAAIEGVTSAEAFATGETYTAAPAETETVAEEQT
jgi:large subunit ribosomal protein L29